MPAFERAALEPVDGPIDLYWYSYPAEVEPLTRQILYGVSEVD